MIVTKRPRASHLMAKPVVLIGSGAGGRGDNSFSKAVDSVARPGTSNILPASAMPTRARADTLHANAKRIRKN